MPFDYSREALYHPERQEPFGTDRPRPALANRTGELTPLEAWYFSNLAHCAYLDPESLRGVLRRVGLTLQRFVERNVFMTAELWGVGSTAPYGHRNDFTTLHDIILAHGGEARKARDAYAEADPQTQQAIIALLRSLVIEP